MQVRPQDWPSDRENCMQHVVMVVPVDANIDETQHITEKNRNQRCQCIEVLAMWHLQLQNHDRDDDGHHAVAECFQAALAHIILRALTKRVLAETTTTMNSAQPEKPAASWLSVSILQGDGSR